MKKILYVLILLLSVSLVACGTEDSEPYTVTEVTFNNETYVYMKTEDNFDIFVSNGHTIEIQYGFVTTITTEFDADIYMIIGSKTAYEITKNGGTILICTGEDILCTGYEDVDFKEDIIGIITEYEKE